MPYIQTDAREWLAHNHLQARTAGELNYTLTGLCLTYLMNKGKSYQTINDIVGALEGAKLEFYRRIAAPYEDQKKHDNGDVYE